MAASCTSLPGQDLQGGADAFGESGFARLDELAGTRACGFQLVHAPPRQLGALARHVERRAVELARRVVCVDATGSSEPWRELAHRLGVTGHEPMAAAARIVREARDAVVLVCAPHATRWGAAVADEVARVMLERGPEAWIVELSTGRRSPHAEALVIEEETTTQDVERFWRALLSEERRAGTGHVERLERLERTWWNARGVAPVEGRLSADAREALGRLALMGRSVGRELQLALEIDGARGELVASGLVASDRGGRLWLRTPTEMLTNEEDTRVVAAALRDSGDAWDGLRAAELLLSIDDTDGAVAVAVVAVGAAATVAREDLWHRLEHALAHAEASADQLLRLSSLALELGDGGPALRLAREAAARADGSCAALLALGRATAARGDLGAAATMLEQARDNATSAAEKLDAAVELAEVLCSAGASERARALAEEAIAATDEPRVRLSARNVIGKLLLAESAWDLAEQSFTEDAHLAAVSGEVEVELRAQLNRATALVGAGRRTEARAVLEAILDRAERAGVLRAEAFALSNLAVLASQRHAYAEALSLREQAIVGFRRIGNRKWLARSMIYLADLRLDLGFVDEAAQALAFARRVLGQAVPPTQAAWLSVVTSRIHLERNQVARALAEVDAALCSAVRSNDGTMRCDCHCLAARVALADGDLGRASAELGEARATLGGANREAEIALLDARVAQATDRPFADAARSALTLARASQDRARMAEAHLLLHEAALRDGDAERARIELESARALHRGISRSLPPELRARYCERIERLGSAAGAIRANPVEQDQPPISRRDRRGRGGMVGSHPTMLSMFSVLDKIAKTEATVLVSGESGTGKELVADAIHRQSGRRGGPQVKVNCAALVETLLMSELFGHEKGAFTGASSQRRGCFEHADGGTVFLDEIGDISPATQAALLRVLQDRTFHRVGGTEPVRVDVRVICATHRDLRTMVEAGTFREDLYYRLSGMVLEVPPLRDRIEDLPLLVSEILLRMSRRNEMPLKRLDADAIALLSGHPWPGNVRELENVLRAAALFSEGDTVTAEDIRRHAVSLRDTASARVSAPRPERGDESTEAPEDAVYAAVRGGTGLRDLQKRLEQECIVRALRETNGHVTRAAALLGIKRPRLSQLIKQHNLRAVGGDSS